MRVLHGMTEVAGQGSYSVRGLRENGVDARMAVWRPNPFGYDYDYNLNIGKCKWLYPYYAVKMFLFAIYATCKFECFHFHFGWSLLPGAMDLKFLKIMKKRVFMEFHGSDIRWSFNREKYDGLPLPPVNKKRQKKIKKILKYVDGVILHDEELRKHLPDIEVPVYIVPLRVNVKDIEPSYPEKAVQKPVIVHAPSKRGNKGTQYVLETLDNIKEDFEFILVENKSHEEAVEIYKKADLIIDQLLAGTYGVFSIEAMALGKPVLTYIDEEMIKTFPEDIPIISSSRYSLKDNLEEMILDADKRNEVGYEGRQYVREYHDYQKNALVLEKIYKGECPELKGSAAFSYIDTLSID